MHCIECGRDEEAWGVLHVPEGGVCSIACATRYVVEHGRVLERRTLCDVCLRWSDRGIARMSKLSSLVHCYCPECAALHAEPEPLLRSTFDDFGIDAPWIRECWTWHLGLRVRFGELVRGSSHTGGCSPYI